MLALKAAGNSVSISVKDHGTGIDRAETDLIFNRYKRGKSRYSTSGAGIGLYSVKTVANKHAGSIAVDSTLGKGTCFTLCLPVLDVERNDAWE